MVEQRGQRQVRRPSTNPGPGRGPRSSSRTQPLTAAGVRNLRKRLRPKLTGRALMVLVVVSVLVVSYASSLKAYLEQRHDITTLQTEIVQRKAHIDKLEKQTTRWQDPAYVKQQARERFGYVMPGETAYVALDEHGNRIDPASKLADPADVGTPQTPKPWWEDAWGSVELAGDPPKQDGTGPETEIGPHKN